MILGVTQQVALVPVFLHFWTSEVLAAWLVIYAVGNLVLIADCGLAVSCDQPVSRLQIERRLRWPDRAFLCGDAADLSGACGISRRAVGGRRLVCFPVRCVLGFQAIPGFDAAFIVMTAGMLLTLPSNLVSGLYRARGLYGRAVRLQNWGMLVAQLGQLVAIVATGSLLAVTIAYVATQLLTAVYFLAIDAPRLFPFLRGVRAKHSWPWIIGQFRKGGCRLRWPVPRSWRCSICPCCWSAPL